MPDVPPPEASYQSLYRRFRPQRFSEVLGQDHVTRALRNAVRDEKVSHGYLFSGPRGTGKTSSARILGKALNCEKLDDGEPCGVCESCQAVQRGTSFDVIELDAASNSGVDQMRDLIQRTSLASPGRWKVYIVDEVHMLTTSASNALLKTLEEPPPHVVFVLATTDPQKVLPTIRSRVQCFDFRLLGNDVLQHLVRMVHDEAGLSLGDADLDRVVRRGAGSGRDALSALDQAAALGSAEEDVSVADEVLEALADRDPARALAAVATACGAGRDPRRSAEDVLARLRDAFLVGRAPQLVDLPPDDRERVADQAKRTGPATLVRAMERIGEALTEMREALDPRITLEVALVRLTAPEADTSPAALAERVERLEERLSTGAETPARAAPAAAPAPPPPPPPPAANKGALGAYRTPKPPLGAAPPSRDELTKAWGDSILERLSGKAKAVWSVARFVDMDDGAAVVALPNQPHLTRCVASQGEVEAALQSHFDRPVPLRLVVDDAKPEPPRAAAAPTPDEDVDLNELTDAPAEQSTSAADRVKQAFPGAQEVE